MAVKQVEMYLLFNFFGWYVICEWQTGVTIISSSSLEESSFAKNQRKITNQHKSL